MPTDTVILEGLPLDLSVSELQARLTSSPVLGQLSSADIRISQSRGYCRAFVQFRSVDEATAFIDEHFPKISLPLPGATPEEECPVHVHFARPRDEGDGRLSRGDRWTCPSCSYSNYSTRDRCKTCGILQSEAFGQRQLLTGESDAADVLSQMLVIYPLDASLTEEMLEVGAKKLEIVEKPRARRETSDGAPLLKSTAPTGDTSGLGARPGSLHRVFIIRDQETSASLKYGFVEFWTVEDAMAAMNKFRLSKTFTIAGTPVAVSNIHLGVFVPEMAEVTPELERFSFFPLFNPVLRVKYWAPHVYPSSRVVTAEAPVSDKAEQGPDGSADPKKSKKRKADGSLASSSAKKPIAMASQMAVWQKKHSELFGEAKGDNAGLGSPTEAGQQGARVATEGSNKASIKISLAGMAKAAAARSSDSNTSPSTSATQGQSPLTPVAGQSAVSPQAPHALVSYVDRDRQCCLLCMMKYKSASDLDIHERSRNHKTAMEDEDKVKVALPRLAARDKRLRKKAGDEEGASDSGLQYRDRAKERRTAFNQPVKPKAQAASVQRNDTKTTTRPAADPAPEAAPPPPKSKGSAMLAKMGWAAGQGLGANSEGRTDIIQTNAYQEGVGLGVEGGNLGDAGELAERNTKGSYAEYLNSAQDKARERYNRLN